MSNELKEILSQLEESYQGDPWFGKNLRTTLTEIDPSKAALKPNANSHSLLQLLYHMNTWRLFVISRFSASENQPLSFFEEKDWEELDTTDVSLWKKGVAQFEALQNQLAALVKHMDEQKLDEIVAERKYNFRKLLYGVIQHDIYHSGQLNYIQKLLAE